MPTETTITTKEPKSEETLAAEKKAKEAPSLTPEEAADEGLKGRIARARIDGTPLDGANGAITLGLQPVNAMIAAIPASASSAALRLKEDVIESVQSQEGGDGTNAGPSNREIYSVSSSGINPLSEEAAKAGEALAEAKQREAEAKAESANAAAEAADAALEAAGGPAPKSTKSSKSSS